MNSWRPYFHHPHTIPFKALCQHFGANDAFELGETNMDGEIRVKRGRWRWEMAALTRSKVQHHSIHLKSGPMEDDGE